MLKVTLKKSTIKSTKSQKQTVRGLGLKKIGQSRVLEDNPALFPLTAVPGVVGPKLPKHPKPISF